MSAHAVWWKERNNENVPRARWFGIFRRSVKLSEDIPQRLSTPSAILSAPRHVSPSDNNALLSPVSLMISCDLNIPENLISGHTQQDDFVFGSAGLAGILLKGGTSRFKNIKTVTTGFIATNPRR